MWSKDLRSEILSEFEQDYAGRTEKILYIRYRQKLDQTSQWARTPEGRRSQRATARRMYQKNRQTVVGQRTCPCGATFYLDAERVRLRRLTYCTSRCQAIHSKRGKSWNGKTLRQWAEHLNVKYDTLWARIRRGVPIEQALRPGHRRPGRRNMS